MSPNEILQSIIVPLAADFLENPNTEGAYSLKKIINKFTSPSRIFRVN